MWHTSSSLCHIVVHGEVPATNNTGLRRLPTITTNSNQPLFFINNRSAGNLCPPRPLHNGTQQHVNGIFVYSQMAAVAMLLLGPQARAAACTLRHTSVPHYYTLCIVLFSVRAHGRQWPEIWYCPCARCQRSPNCCPSCACTGRNS